MPVRLPVVHHVPVQSPPAFTKQQIEQLRAELTQAVLARDEALQRAKDAECQNQRLSELQRQCKRKANAATERQIAALQELQNRERVLRTFQSKYDSLRHSQAVASKQAAEQLNAIQRNNAELRERNATLCRMLSERQREVAAAESLCDRLRNTNANVTQLQAAQAQLRQANESINDLSQALRQATASVKKSNEARRQAEAEVKIAKEQLRVYEAIILGLVGVIVDQASRLSSLEAAVKQREASLARLQKQSDEAKQHMTRLQCQNMTLDRLVADLEAERDAAKRQVCHERVRAAQRFGATQFELAQEKQRMQALERRYEDLQRSALEEADQLKESNRTLQASLDASREQAREAAAAIEALQARGEDADFLREEKRSADAEIDRLSAECTAVTKRLAVAESERDAAEQLALLLAAALGTLVIAVFGAVVGFFVSKRDGEAVTVPDFDPDQFKVVIENERWYPVSGWSQKLLPTDRHRFTEIDGSTQAQEPGASYALLADECWKDDGGWRVESAGSSDGWLYALDFPRTHYTEMFPSACVRRRIHVREFVIKEMKPDPTARSMLMAGHVLHPGEILTSSRGEFKLVHQTDGNLVLYDRVKALWSTKTWGKATSKLDLQHDGNLVLYDSKGKALWSSKTCGKPAAYLEMQDDGKAVLYAQDGRPLWSTSS